MPFLFIINIIFNNTFMLKNLYTLMLTLFEKHPLEKI